MAKTKTNAPKITTSEALKIVTTSLKKDYNYRQGFKATIAMAFQDEFEKQQKIRKSKFNNFLNNECGLNEIANTAADNFLDSLIAK